MYSSTDFSMLHLRVLQTNDLRQFSCRRFTVMYRATGGGVRNAPIVSQLAVQFIVKFMVDIKAKELEMSPAQFPFFFYSI
jgi:hypothetical protein